LTPHRVAAATAYTQQLLVQSSVDVENFVRRDLMEILALEKDRVALNGLGSAGEPLGIANTTNLSTSVTLTNAGTLTYAKACEFELNISTSNALRNRLGFLTTPTVRSGTRQSPRFSNTDTPVWEPGDTILGYPARASNNVPSTSTVFFGNWADLVIGNWGNGYELIVDPYSLSLQGQIRIVLNHLTDCGLRQSKSFAISTN
jgi:HK97 family phage major capsid protein